MLTQGYSCTHACTGRCRAAMPMIDSQAGHCWLTAQLHAGPTSSPESKAKVCLIKQLSVTVSAASLPCAMLHTLHVLSREAVMAMALSCPAPTWMSVTGSVCCDLHAGRDTGRLVVHCLTLGGTCPAAPRVAGKAVASRACGDQACGCFQQALAM